MYKRTKSVLCAAAALVLALSGVSTGVPALPLMEDISASAEVQTGKCGESVNFELNGSVLTISGTGEMYNFTLGRSPWLYVSDTITTVVIGNGVTSVGDSAFYGFSKLNTVSIAGSVNNIGNYAFYGCGLGSVSIPGTVSVISDGAFSDCLSLKSVTLGNGVSEIGSGAFAGCTSLDSIYLPDSIDEIGGGAFTDTPWLNKLYSNGLAIYKEYLLDGTEASGAVSIPTGVKTICGSAFYGCTGITSVNMPAGLETVGDYAFENCTALASVNFNNDLSELGAGAFSGCKSLKSVSIPYGVSCLSYGLFEKCSSLSGITLSSNVSDISEYAFRDCKALTKIELNGGLASIADYAFDGCTNLSDITFPDSVENIGASAFESTKWFAEQKRVSPVVIVNKIVVNGKKASGLVALPQGVTTISENAFAGASNITNIIIPESVTDIGSGAFLDCSSLTSVTIPAGVTSLGTASFGFATDKTTGEPVAVKGFTLRCTANSDGASYAAENGISYVFSKNDSSNALAVKSASADFSPAKVNITLYNEKGSAVKTVVPDSAGNVNLSSVAEGSYDMEITCQGFVPLTVPYTAGGSLGTISLCKYGDLNGNGLVEVNDLIVLQKKQAGWNVGVCYEEAADLDGDGKQTVSDLMLLQKYTAGWKVKLGK